MSFLVQQSFDTQPRKPSKDHIVCCDPSTAICGADQRGEMFGMGAPDPKRMCTACATLSKDPMFKCSATCQGDRT